MASFIRRVPTASGARAVQIMHKRGRQVVGIEHIGSAHDDAQLAVLMELARQQLHAGSRSSTSVRLWSRPRLHPRDRPGHQRPGPRVVGMRSQVLWDVLDAAYSRLGFDVVADEAFKALVLTRIVEPCGAQKPRPVAVCWGPA